MFEEIEVATILRVVPSLVPEFNDHIQRGDPTTIRILPNKKEDVARLCELTLGASKYQGLLFDLPRHVETYKTLDSEQYFKTNDVGQILIIFDNITEMDKYKGNRYYPHGLTKPLEEAYKTLTKSLESLTQVPPPDVSAIEAIIYNQHTSNFTYAEVVEEQPHMKMFGNSYSTKKEKGKVFQ
ncbi:hypothetical protein WA588_002923, partial [Blastocystis sp. NMH]